MGCVGTKKNGEPCNNPIIADAENHLCYQHSEGGAAKLAKARQDAWLRKISDKEMRQPPEAFYAEGWNEMPFRPAAECAQRFDTRTDTVTRWYAYVRAEQIQSQTAADWEGPERDFPATHWDLTTDHIPALIADFLRFRSAYCRDPRGRPYVTPGFQRRWLEAVLTALVTGGRQIILSPPRHGKTELLIHFCEWLIARFPNIRILWVGGNERIASRSLMAVAAALVNNRKLREDFAGPSGSFKPQWKSSLPWTKTEFTVATRNIDMKGATMTALGRGGTLLSLDADIIIGDDIEDHQSTAQPGAREGTREWWTSQLESRKEETTGLFYIGSRQHPDDLAGHLVDNEEYDSIVETAHDFACDIPQDDPDRYGEHTDCMLFPELRSFRWLMSQKHAASTAGGTEVFQMVYLNRSDAEGLQVFTAEKVKPCRNHQRVVGEMPKDVPIRLVGGLDPSGSGYQAAFLWAYQVNEPDVRMWMIDLENQEGGGIAKARDSIRHWWDKYRLSHWVIEENLYQGGITDDEQIRDFCATNGVVLEGFRTYYNKLDATLGVTTLAPMFAERRIDLPYGDGPSQVKTDAYVNQLIYWDGKASRNRNTRAGYKSDLVMASWFPMVVVRRAHQEQLADADIDLEPMFSGMNWSQAPWETAEDAPWVA